MKNVNISTSRILSLIFLTFLFVVLNNLASAQTGWTPELSTKVKGIGAVHVSPDGKKVVYTVNEAVMTPDKSENVTQIWAANADGSGAMRLTYAEKSSENPQWSPDNNMLAFTSARSGKSNLYVMRVGGGEAEQITDVKSGVGNFAWAPEGKRIAFIMRDAPTEDEEKAAKGKDDSRWVDENVKMNRLYVIDLEKGANGKREPRKLTGDYNINGDFNWSPDGRKIAFTRTKMPKADYWTSANILAVDVANAEVKPLAASGAAETGPHYSPDGQQVAFMITDDPPRWASHSRIAIMPAAGGTPRLLAETFDGQPEIIDWSADGKSIYFSEARGTLDRIYAINVAADKIVEVSKAEGVIFGENLNRSRTMFGFTMQKPDVAPEAYVSSADRFVPVQISRANAELPKLPIGRTEVLHWKSADGMEIEGLLTYPVGYQAGTRVPLVLNVHGGPTGVFSQTFLVSRSPYPLAAFAAHGFAILRVNPRGSSGYGKDFRFANIKDWGGGDYKDLMTGVDKVIEMGVADPERLGVMGWSYGGFMTSWIITQTHRFKAASVGAGVTNLMSFVGTADIPSFLPDYFGGPPWEVNDTYRAHSAMFNVKGVTTPTLIEHGEADERVPISQGYELYNALKAQNVPVRMIVLPRMPHGPNEPKMALKAAQANLDWFEKYLMPKEKAGTKE